GWVVAQGDVDANGHPGAVVLSVVGDFATVLAMDADRIAIDIPIGLESERHDGGRACDIAARSLLDLARGSSVFPAPPRPALDLRSFEDPRRTAFGLTQQSFALLPRIRDVDASIEPSMQDPVTSRPLVMEVHPEVVFTDLNEGNPIASSKRTEEGRLRRRILLEGVLGRPIPVIHPQGAADDDILDALACLWVAAAPAAALSAVPAGEPTRDARGLAMRIWRRDAVGQPALSPRRTVRAAFIDHLLGAIGPMDGVKVTRGAERRHPASPDLRLRGERTQVLLVVETVGGGGALAELWPELHDRAVAPPSLAVEVYAGPARDRDDHRQFSTFLVARMEDDLGPRGLGDRGGWDAELVDAGHGLTDPVPALAARIRAALGLPERD
ncbi:MAG: DUF429 domain-containing protein, partial [Chloroflexota bacterium]